MKKVVMIQYSESDNVEDKCKLTGPRSRRTQGYHRRLMERAPLCIPCNDDGDTKLRNNYYYIPGYPRLRLGYPSESADE